ncbi:hypothetical protein KPH14_008612 [Odynerus spinipes]|uniref:Chitin-binding type-2 domain-containing protein n=1 Tax=Odynerus spinipes TaxID=1348599 RepID=A0AAD9RT09_9HYME|nr:hypothetical protein KPH14_008612 [Odynerus spinipes]
MGDAFLVILKVCLLKLLIFYSVQAQITCTAPGFFPLLDTTCQYYYLCYSDGTGLSAQISKCPGTTVFDPNRSACVLPTQYSCVETTTTTDPYPCLRAGRFPISDPTCKSYYMCYWETATLVRRMFRCPAQTIFNPTRELCVLPTTYVCGGTTTSTSTTPIPGVEHIP